MKTADLKIARVSFLLLFALVYMRSELCSSDFKQMFVSYVEDCSGIV